MTDATTPQAFQALGLSSIFQDKLDKADFHQPTDIQTQAIPQVLAGRDLVARAPTGSGKSAAFLLPILQLIWSPEHHRMMLEPGAPRALVLVPTRELANQLGSMARRFQPPKTTPPLEITGGVPYPPQFRMLERPQPVIIATPGRLIDLMDDQRISLEQLEMLVLDEADRMLEMGFTEALDQVLAAAPKECQKLLFSATMPSWVKKAAAHFLTDPARVEVGELHGNTPQIEQGVYYCPEAQKLDVLAQLLAEEDLSKVVVFTNTKAKADRIESELRRLDIRTAALHGDHSQGQRRKSLKMFSDGAVRVLAASDVAARGVDLPQVSHVINFDLPREYETYVHRIGRTGRANQEGTAISLCDHFERGMIRLVEKKHGIEMIVLGDTLPPRAKGKRESGKNDRRSGSTHMRPEWSNRPDRADRRGKGEATPRFGELERNRQARSAGWDPDDMAAREQRSEDAGSRPRREGKPFEGKRYEGRRPDSKRFERADRAGETRRGAGHSQARYDDKRRDDRNRDDRYRDDRPRADRSHGDRSQGDRSYSDRPRGDRPYSDRPRGDRPFQERPYREKPQRSSFNDNSQRHDDAFEGRQDYRPNRDNGKAGKAAPGARKSSRPTTARGQEVRPKRRAVTGGKHQVASYEQPQKQRANAGGKRSYIDRALDSAFGPEKDDG